MTPRFTRPFTRLKNWKNYGANYVVSDQARLFSSKKRWYQHHSHSILFHKHENASLDTGIEIPVKYWDKQSLKIRRDIPPEYGIARKINDALDAQLSLVAEIIKYAEKRNITDKDKFVKKYYKPDLDIYSLDELVKKDDQERVVLEIEKKKTEIDVFHQIDLYIMSKIKKVSKDMPRIYRNMKDHLLAYQKARKIARQPEGGYYQGKYYRGGPLLRIWFKDCRHQQP